MNENRAMAFSLVSLIDHILQQYVVCPVNACCHITIVVYNVVRVHVCSVVMFAYVLVLQQSLWLYNVVQVLFMCSGYRVQLLLFVCQSLCTM